MAFINLLPESQKRKRSAVQTQKKERQPLRLPAVPKNVIVIPGIVFVIGLICVVIFFISIALRQKTLAAIEQKVQNFRAASQQMQELSLKKEQLTSALAYYNNLFSNWKNHSQTLMIIKRHLPPQIWLTSVSLDTKIENMATPVVPDQYGQSKTDPQQPVPQPRKISTLDIRGTSTSLIEEEIITSITQLAMLLKKDADFSAGMTDLKMGSLQQGKRGNLNVMNFSLIFRFEENR